VELLGKYLSKENITRVYSSDYLRAYKTAEGIAKSSKNEKKLEVKTDVRLRERVCLCNGCIASNYKSLKIYHVKKLLKTSKANFMLSL